MNSATKHTFKFSVIFRFE